MNGVPWITRICPKVSLDRKTVRAGTLKCVSLCSSRRTLCTSSAQTHVGSKSGCIEKIFSKSVFLLKQHAQNLPGTGLVYFYILGHFLLTVCSCHKSQTFFYIFYSTLQLSNASADTLCSSLSHWCFHKLGFSFTHEISHYTVLFPHIVGKKILIYVPAATYCTAADSWVCGVSLNTPTKKVYTTQPVSLAADDEAILTTQTCRQWWIARLRLIWNLHIKMKKKEKRRRNPQHLSINLFMAHFRLLVCFLER